MKQRSQLFQAFREYMWNTRGAAPTTVDRYYGVVMQANRWLESQGRRGILWADAASLRAFLFSSPPNARTRNAYRQALMAWGDFMIHMEFADVNPASGLPRLPEPQSLPKPHEPNEVRMLLAAAKFLGPMYEVMISLFFFGGLRNTETRLLEWVNVQEDWLQFRVKSRGGRTRERVVPLHPDLKSALRRWRLECPDPQWVFPSSQRQGQPWSGRHFADLVKRVADEAGVKTHPHKGRTSFATELYEQTKDIYLVKEALGHASLSTTQIYAKVRPFPLRDPITRLSYRKEPSPNGQRPTLEQSPQTFESP